MKISIPSFFTSLYFGSILWVSGYLIYSTGIKFTDEADTFKQLGMLCFYLIFPAALLFIAIKTKWIILNSNSITAIYPLKLHIIRLELSEVKKLSWRLWGTVRAGDYRMLDITFKSGQLITISDLEFQNFDSLEQVIINSSSHKPNLKTRNQNRYDQAKTNIWFSTLILIVTVFVIGISYSKMVENDFSNKVSIAFFTIGTLVLARLIFQIKGYINRLRKKA
ncbi:hypothetical protein N6H18_03650 [Reichenbachiella agarivorans]|uniref:PH domain-containing protein n=1 Tax=Reichenbachiella agarivorans TaxID=2979464 RepID=A0ABY6CRB9_9BACT|nr:hypothetical protein [Reichenbachiella agarivorans]UXP33051.1 hypothetical protein N6H18_03650 [Reichenbachiella agarivorans]